MGRAEETLVPVPCLPPMPGSPRFLTTGNQGDSSRSISRGNTSVKCFLEQSMCRAGEGIAYPQKVFCNQVVMRIKNSPADFETSWKCNVSARLNSFILQLNHKAEWPALTLLRGEAQFIVYTPGQICFCLELFVLHPKDKFFAEPEETYAGKIELTIRNRPRFLRSVK